VTNKERVISLLGFAPANDNAIEGALIDLGIDGALTYDALNTVLIKKAAIQVMQLLLTTADTHNENDYRITFDRDAVIARIKLLKGEIGEIDESQPFVTSRSVW
jgi:hypothetical protein